MNYADTKNLKLHKYVMHSQLNLQQSLLLRKTANKSHIQRKHAAMVLYKGTPIACENNFIQGSKTYHAEFAVIRRVLFNRGFISWFKENCILWRET